MNQPLWNILPLIYITIAKSERKITPSEEFESIILVGGWTNPVEKYESNIFWVWPLPSNSDLFDDSIFSRESPTKPLFATGILGRGHTQNILYYLQNGFQSSPIVFVNIWVATHHTDLGPTCCPIRQHLTAQGAVESVVRSGREFFFFFGVFQGRCVFPCFFQFFGFSLSCFGIFFQFLFSKSIPKLF